jgi:hypothetical protein
MVMTITLEFEDNLRTPIPWTNNRNALWAVRLLITFVLVTVTCTPIVLFILSQRLDQSVPQTTTAPSFEHLGIKNSTDVNHTRHITQTILRTSPTMNMMKASSMNTLSISRAGSCKPSYTIHPYYGCVASCPYGQTRYTHILKSFVYITSAIQFFCAIAIVYTWVKVKSLRETLAHANIVLTTTAYAVGAVVVAVPLLAGRRNVLCASDDIITHYENGPTKSCVILG